MDRRSGEETEVFSSPLHRLRLVLHPRDTHRWACVSNQSRYEVLTIRMCLNEQKILNTQKWLCVRVCVFRFTVPFWIHVPDTEDLYDALPHAGSPVQRSLPGRHRCGDTPAPQHALHTFHHLQPHVQTAGALRDCANRRAHRRAHTLIHKHKEYTREVFTKKHSMSLWIIKFTNGTLCSFGT